MGYQRLIFIGLRYNKNYNYKNEYGNGGKQTRHIRFAPTTRTNDARPRHNGEAQHRLAADRLHFGSWHRDKTRPVWAGGSGPNTEAKGTDAYALSPHTAPARKPHPRRSPRGLNNAPTSNPKNRTENQERPYLMTSQAKATDGPPTVSMLPS